MSRRGEYIWAPFQSLFNTNKVLEEIKNQKKIHPKPILRLSANKWERKSP